jgi:Barstar (barnase inhibitor)
MNFVHLDAREWNTPLDFYEALLAALGAPHWHGRSINALIDSMIYGGINEIEPPLTVRITGNEHLPEDVKNELAFVVLAFGEHQGTDRIVEFQGTL